MIKPLNLGPGHPGFYSPCGFFGIVLFSSLDAGSAH